MKGGGEKKKDDGFDAKERITINAAGRDRQTEIYPQTHTPRYPPPTVKNIQPHPYLFLYSMLSFWVLQYTEHLMGRSRKPQATIHNKNQSAFMYASEESIREYIALLPPPSLHLPVHLAQTSTTPNALIAEDGT